MSSPTRKYRGRSNITHVIALSISYERDDLLARGLGLEHLREMLNRLARTLLRSGASLAYGGNWNESEENFTFELLRLINAEQEDNEGDSADAMAIGRLYNHLAWPHYLAVTPRIEALWVRCCRIVRVSQEMAQIPEEHRATDAEAAIATDRVALNAAIALSAMRRLSVTGTALLTPGLPRSESVPPLSARILLGGKLRGYSGFLPGIFEEALVTLEAKRPLYVLGGFGGAAGVLAEALLAPPGIRPRQMEVSWLEAENPKHKSLMSAALTVPMPPGSRSTAASMEQLHTRIDAIRANLADGLNSGLSGADTKELLGTRDTRRAIHLVIEGLKRTIGLEERPS